MTSRSDGPLNLLPQPTWLGRPNGMRWAGLYGSSPGPRRNESHATDRHHRQFTRRGNFIIMYALYTYYCRRRIIIIIIVIIAIIAYGTVRGPRPTGKACCENGLRFEIHRPRRRWLMERNDRDRTANERKRSSISCARWFVEDFIAYNVAINGVCSVWTKIGFRPYRTTVDSYKTVSVGIKLFSFNRVYTPVLHK